MSDQHKASPERCAKCSSVDLWRGWCSGGNRVGSQAQGWAERYSVFCPDGEHFHRMCRDCGYRWREPSPRSPESPVVPPGMPRCSCPREGNTTTRSASCRVHGDKPVVPPAASGQQTLPVGKREPSKAALAAAQAVADGGIRSFASMRRCIREAYSVDFPVLGGENKAQVGEG